MGLLDSILQAAGGTSAPAPHHEGLLNGVVQVLSGSQTGGIAGLVQNFERAGLAHLVQSWVGTGENLAATPQQIQQGLGADTIQQLAHKVGISPDVAAASLASLLPMLIDKLTPHGQVPASSAGLEGLLGQFGQLGGLGQLAGLFGQK